ncbi:MAG: SLC13 family permease, partial [Kiritimatiellaeota bacterium]|nr:SLC13 family permease [Kiritimatiellota bacterium]
QLIPIADLEAKGHLALSVFGWILTWWITQPIPWAITAFLPLVLFPLLDVMAIRGTVVLYGQRILPFLMGVMIFGHAFYKHGLAKRFALALLGIKGLASSGNRIILLIIIATAIVSAVVDDAASVAIFIPIAMSLARAVTDIYSKTEGGGKGAPKFLAACALGVLYGAGAGGLMTPLAEDYLTIDFIRDRGYPVVFVTSGKLGSISHTLLAFDALKTRGMRLHSVLYNGFPEGDKIISEDTERFLRAVVERDWPGTEFVKVPVL